MRVKLILLFLVTLAFGRGISDAQVHMILSLHDGTEERLQVADGMSISLGESGLEVTSADGEIIYSLGDVLSFSYTNVDDSSVSLIEASTPIDIHLENGIIRICGAPEDTGWSITDLSGKRIAGDKFSVSTEITVSDFATGIYIMSTDSGQSLKFQIKN